MQPEGNDPHNRPIRLYLMGLGMAFLFSLLLVQFFRIQVVEHDNWNRIATRQHYFSIKEPFHRGVFFTTDSPRPHHSQQFQQLVFEIEKFHLFADPQSIPEEFRGPIREALTEILDLSEEQQVFVANNLAKKSRSRRLFTWLEGEQKEAVEKWWKPFAKQSAIARNALFFTPDYQRSYPYGKLLGQVLHTTQLERDEETGEAFPTGGLELQFNHYLKGKPGKRRLMRSPRNAFEIGEQIESPQDGADIYLTIDQTIQTIVEEEIAKAVKRWKAQSGWAVMIDPHSGAILAMGQFPHFYPANYRDYFNDKQMIDATRVKALTDAPEPGSVMKPLTLAIALMANEELERRGEAPLFSPDEKIATLNGNFPGRPHPLKDSLPHAYLNMYMALQKTSNIYMAVLIQRVIERLGTKWYRSTLTDVLGLGEKTGIELPGESSGRVPRPGKMHANGTLEWSVPTPYSIAMGHNIQITSMQLVKAYCFFANGGKAVRPTLIEKIVSHPERGKDVVVYDRKENLERNPLPQVISSSIIDNVVDAMKFVTKSGGSGFRADIPGYSEAGKTGTAEKVVGGEYSRHDHHMALFIGFAPVENPAFVLLVVIDEPDPTYIPGVGRGKYGSVSSAPVFREIGKRTLAYLGVPQDDPHGFPKGDPRYDAENGYWMKEAEDLINLYNRWNAK